uniref:Putative secreted protein n=1 Tax=Anopheles darlingi TaxID=43151 RepID=A0A2M4DCY7_ANODA
MMKKMLMLVSLLLLLLLLFWSRRGRFRVIRGTHRSSPSVVALLYGRERFSSVRVPTHVHLHMCRVCVFIFVYSFAQTLYRVVSRRLLVTTDEPPTFAQGISYRQEERSNHFTASTATTFVDHHRSLRLFSSLAFETARSQHQNDTLAFRTTPAQ